MLNAEVLITPALEAAVLTRRTLGCKRSVEVLRIDGEEVRWREIGSSAKPPRFWLARLFGIFNSAVKQQCSAKHGALYKKGGRALKVTVVEMHGRCGWIMWMHDAADTARFKR